jgi:hypothetical protein
MTGELQPIPGMSIFHTTFSVELHVSGRAGSSSATPAEGPRKRGQSFVAERVRAEIARKAKIRKDVGRINIYTFP